MTGGPRGGSGAAVRAANAQRDGKRGVRQWMHLWQPGLRYRRRCAYVYAQRAVQRVAGHVLRAIVCLDHQLDGPEPRQINSTGLGWTKGDATATPIDNTNHANTRRASHRRLRRVLQGQVACGGIVGAPCAGRDRPFRFMTQVNSATPALRTGFWDVETLAPHFLQPSGDHPC